MLNEQKKKNLDFGSHLDIIKNNAVLQIMAIKSESSLGWSVLPVMIWKPLIRWQKEMEEISVFYFVFAGIVMRSFYARKKSSQL